MGARDLQNSRLYSSFISTLINLILFRGGCRGVRAWLIYTSQACGTKELGKAAQSEEEALDVNNLGKSVVNASAEEDEETVARLDMDMGVD